MLENAKEARDKAIKLIEKLEDARSDRENVNYEVAQAVIENAAKNHLESADQIK